MTRAKEWDKEGRDNSFLLRGKNLAAAEAVQVREAEKEPKLTPLQKEYILASRQATARFQRVTLAAVMLGLIIAVILAVLAWSQRTEAISQRNEAESQKNLALGHLMAAQAELGSNQGGSSLERSVLLAVEAKQRLPSSVEADQVLHRGLTLLRRTVASLTYDDFVKDVAFSPDGKYLATASGDKTTRLWL